MDVNDENITVKASEYQELLQKLKDSETEKNRLARELRTSEKRSEIHKLNFQAQTSINKIIEGEKEKQQTYVRLLLESCPDIIFVFDEQLKFLLFTNSISKIIDIDDISLLQGRELNSIIERYNPPAFTEAVVSSIKNVMESQSDENIEKKLRIEAQNSKYEVNMLPFRKTNGDFAGVLVIMHDVTQLIEAMEIAEHASNAKGDFLSRMSHEMRTPMNAIIGMTNIAKSSDDPGKKEYCLDKIESASKHLLGVINDVLDIAKIEANKFELTNEEFDFEKMLMSVVNIVNFKVEEKNQNLIINLNKDVPISLIGDEFHLAQVITNLLTNAGKFTPEGGVITLNVKNVFVQDEEYTVQIEVSDNGIGIPKDHQERLFNSFEQADGSTARKYGGTGLGLAISKRIVELMGGKIWIESEPGQGSKFIFTFKAKKGNPKERARLVINKEDIRILAVDDSSDIREYFTHFMGELALPCDVAQSGEEALQMLNNHGGKPYNIFFVDWQMPEMDGIELTRKIKEITKDNSVVIMISVAKWSDIEKDAIAAGISSFIPKPLFPSALVNTINECLDITQERTSVIQNQASQKERDFSAHTLLLAEDIKINREILMHVLKGTGVSVDFAQNGIEAVELFSNCPSKYSLILMDIQMPEMDGYEATRQIRSINCDEAKNIPIIAMTANVFKEDVEKCIEVGMNDHLGKPIDNKELFRKLEIYLSKL